MNRNARRLATKQTKRTSPGQSADVQRLIGQAAKFHGEGRPAEAARCLLSALRIDPFSADLHSNLAILMGMLGRFDEALSSVGRAVAIAPGNPLHYFNLGAICARAGRLDGAAWAYRCVARLNPSDHEALANLSGLLLKLDRPAEAADVLRGSLRLNRDQPMAHFNLGNALFALGELAEAEMCFRRVINLDAAYVNAYVNLGGVLRKQGKSSDAVVCYRKAIDRFPNMAALHFNCGNVLEDLSRLDEAVAAYRKACALQPDFFAAAINLGDVLHQQGAIDEAEQVYRRVLASEPDNPDASWNLSSILLLRGQYEEGWRKYECRTRRLDPDQTTRRDFVQPSWTGQDAKPGRLFLWHEQGMGDAIQFSRYATLFAERGWTVILEAPSPLKRLLASVPGVSQVVSAGEAPPDFDRQLSMMSAPHRLGTSMNDIPARVPYVAADQRQIAAWAERVGSLPGVKVGLVWAGEARRHLPRADAIDRRRSLALVQLLPLLRTPGITFVSLQKGSPSLQLAEVDADIRPRDWMDEMSDFADTAALAANLDLVISVDTSVAHLVGAMGKPVWIFSRFDGCWRWLLDRDDSPWYPTARLFRQSAPGDWGPVVERVRAELSRLVSGDR